ncbi:glycoside hydrolase family 97 protein [uncultured Muribaculum sp.]|uniref:glycoside hydrolase family 97 protein n=3 Tax=uncultured Muribaculum sp. TaxID=1918613 RepID=UPI0025CF8D54|nr:glycoside hydrolase family 97 protein [uncultured Muribaculum sp.]
MKTKIIKTKAIVLSALLAAALNVSGESVSGPDGRLVVDVTAQDGTPVYSVTYDGKNAILPAPLGFESDIDDFSKGMTLVGTKRSTIDKSYTQSRIKKGEIDFKANVMECTFRNDKGHEMTVEFVVADNDLAFRYAVPTQGPTSAIRILDEKTSFRLPEGTTTFLTPQSKAMIGWKRSKPSYEEEYSHDAPMDTTSKYGNGYTFPALFNLNPEGLWVLVSETGVDGRYCASRLGEFRDAGYEIEFPMPEENNGNGTSEPAFALPGHTPWRTLTVGNSLKPVVETTIPWDVVAPLYEPSTDYMPGKGTWAWILWQDASSNYEDLKTFIDFAADMGYEYSLIDANWDKNPGREKTAELMRYAVSRGVSPFMWYSSSGYWNDIRQTPVNHMDNPVVRKKEMKWLKENGAKGIKVDFFGGDKQETMRLYEQILSDADDYGLMVIFHGCTLPRGWERMYPNYVGSEAVLASENLIFDQHFCDEEARNATLHPFIRNTVGSMEYGGSFMNRRMNRGNDGGNYRRTSDIFELALAILFQNSVQNFALAPNNLSDAPEICMDFLKDVPVSWDETVFIDGYPGKYAVIGRRNADKWYIGAINATSEPLKLELPLPMIAGEKVKLYNDTYRKGVSGEIRKAARKGEMRPALADDFVPSLHDASIPSDGVFPVTILPSGGIVIVGAAK